MTPALNLNLDEVVANSFRNFHAVGMDYLCLMRSRGLTLKAYFFDDAIEGELVCPHNHRYSFDTRVVSGGLVERSFFARGRDEDDAFDVYRFATPLDGGTGFAESTETTRMKPVDTKCWSGDTYSNRAHIDVHTLVDIAAGTVLLLTQYADVPPAATKTFVRQGSPMPGLTGLYQKMTRGEACARIDQLEGLLCRGAL